MTAVEARTGFSITRLFGTCFALARRNALLFATFALVFSVLPSVIFAALPQQAEGDSILAQMRGRPIDNVVTTLCNLALSILVIRAAWVHLSGGRPGWSDSLAALGRTYAGAIWLTIITNVGILFGTLFFVVPGVILVAAWYATLPVRVIEGRNVTFAISRSGELTRGVRAPILAFALLWIVGFVVAGVSASLLVSVVLGVVAPGLLDPLIDFVVLPISFALLFVFAPTTSVAVYAELVALRGGDPGDRLASVFD